MSSELCLKRRCASINGLQGLGQPVHRTLQGSTWVSRHLLRPLQSQCEAGKRQERRPLAEPPLWRERQEQQERQGAGGGRTAPSGSARSGRGARAQQSGRAAERQSGRAPWAEAAEGQRRQRGQRELAMRACVCVRACTQQQCKGALPDLQSETAALQSSSRS